MKRKQQMIRILALVLVVLLVGGAVLSALMAALAEESAPVRDAYEINIDYMEEQEALQVTQRLVYHNPNSIHLDRVCFYAAGNMFRRESALIYESKDFFPAGFTPSGIDIQSVLVDGAEADWGVQGTDETILRVACDLQPGESCVFEFQYYLLLAENAAMLGFGETDVRLSAFYFAPALYDEEYDDFVANPALQHTRWLHTSAADFDVVLTIPDLYLPAATGTGEMLLTENHRSLWRFTAENVREFALSFGKRYRESSAVTDSGVTIRVLSNDRSGAARALEYTESVIDVYERWLGAFPSKEIDIVQSDYAQDPLNFPGTVWIPGSAFTDEAKLESAIRFCLAQQYIGMAAYAQPVADAWLIDVPCLYLSLLAVEELKGHDAFLTALNEQVLASLNITIPGGMYITLDASLFNANDYAVVVRDRGTVVMHELRLAMGRESFLDAMQLFFEKGLQGDVLTEMDFVGALNEATGGDWETFLADWLYSVDEYVGQEIEFYE